LTLEQPHNLDEAVTRAESQNPNVQTPITTNKKAREDVTQNEGNLLPEVNLVAARNAIGARAPFAWARRHLANHGSNGRFRFIVRVLIIRGVRTAKQVVTEAAYAT